MKDMESMENKKGLERSTELTEVKTGDKSKLSKAVWLCLGTVMCILSIIGLMLPVIPQIPFILAMLICFNKGSEKFHAWILQNRIYKRFLEKYLEKHMQDRKSEKDKKSGSNNNLKCERNLGFDSNWGA